MWGGPVASFVPPREREVFSWEEIVGDASGDILGDPLGDSAHSALSTSSTVGLSADGLGIGLGLGGGIGLLGVSAVVLRKLHRGLRSTRGRPALRQRAA